MPAMAEKKGPLRNSAFYWKVIGYAGGPERLLRDCIEGHAYDDKDFEWIMNHVVGANARKALKYVHDSDSLPKELTIPGVQRTIGGWEDRKNKFEELAGAGSGKDEVPDKHITFSGRLKMLAADAELPETERPGADILKYKDEDLKEYQ